MTIDLGDESTINMIELNPEAPKQPEKKIRVRERDISLYAKNDGATSPGAWTKITGWRMERNAETGALRIYFANALKARSVKVTTIWDDRNEANESVTTFGTFKRVAKELVKVWTLTNTHTETYDYDKTGNRTKLGETKYWYYTNKMDGNLPMVRSDGNWYYTYDAAGNRTAKGKAVIGNGLEAPIDTSKEYWTYEWDLHNRLVAVSQYVGSATVVHVTYAYDAENYRVSRIGKNGTTVYAYGRVGALTYQKNISNGGVERSYAYLDNQIVGWYETKDGVTSKYYAETDQLGSVTGVTDASGNEVWGSEYLPFGKVAGAEGAYRFEGMYTGKDIDSETGLTYHWNRWRNEEGSAFISEDPARDGINWYGYVGNNPINAYDSSGLYITPIQSVYKMNDENSSWAFQLVGNTTDISETMGEVGCLVTTEANMLASFGVKKDP